MVSVSDWLLPLLLEGGCVEDQSLTLLKNITPQLTHLKPHTPGRRHAARTRYRPGRIYQNQTHPVPPVVYTKIKLVSYARPAQY